MSDDLLSITPPGFRSPSPSTDSDSLDHEWLEKPEFPTAEELMSPTEPYSPAYFGVNIPNAPFISKARYLRTHYNLVREDNLAPLRDAVKSVRDQNFEWEGANFHVYQNVYIRGFTLSDRGLATRISFSAARSRKKIKWEFSDRLKTGSLIAITVVGDNFASVCKVATVVARPLHLLEKSPPRIDIQFSDTNELEIDPQKEWLVVEATSGYWESCRATLGALQQKMSEKSSLDKYFVQADREIRQPEFLGQNFSREDFDVEVGHSNLDRSQAQALEKFSTRDICLIQGPPGTGKTHVSIAGLRLLLKTTPHGANPIVVCSKTNHALDQLLRHVVVFEPDVVRLGSGSQDEIIQEKNLQQRKDKFKSRIKGQKANSSKVFEENVKALAQWFRKTLRPFFKSNAPLPFEFFHELGLLSDAQLESTIPTEDDWVSADGPVVWDISTWLEGAIEPATQNFDDFDPAADFEDIDPELQQFLVVPDSKNPELRKKDLSRRNESLRGPYFELSDPFRVTSTIRRKPAVIVDQLRKQNLWKIPRRFRGILYAHLRTQALKLLKEKIITQAINLSSLCSYRETEKVKMNKIILDDVAIIGVTATGLSIYRDLFKILKPRILMVEEAAECIEADVVAGCFESIQQLILVGDHQQLQPSCNVRQFGQSPFNLNVSLFERLVKTGRDFSILTTQRRMRPDISRLLRPTYGFEDHEVVEDRSNIPGMGRTNCFFFSHTWPEEKDSTTSIRNPEEARFLVKHFEFLYRSGLPSDKITVLTLYNGQRKYIHNLLRKSTTLSHINFFHVYTVDKFQGNENEVVLLSLVRNHHGRHLGILLDDHRVVVALSRARTGLYIYGNADLLETHSEIWREVISKLRTSTSNGNQVRDTFLIKCDNHGTRTLIKEPNQWGTVMTGCSKPCLATMRCGHICSLDCHIRTELPHRCQANCPDPSKPKPKAYHRRPDSIAESDILDKASPWEIFQHVSSKSDRPQASSDGQASKSGSLDASPEMKMSTTDFAKTTSVRVVRKVDGKDRCKYIQTYNPYGFDWTDDVGTQTNNAIPVDNIRQVTTPVPIETPQIVNARTTNLSLVTPKPISAKQNAALVTLSQTSPIHTELDSACVPDSPKFDRSMLYSPEKQDPASSIDTPEMALVDSEDHTPDAPKPEVTQEGDDKQGSEDHLGDSPQFEATQANGCGQESNDHSGDFIQSGAPRVNCCGKESNDHSGDSPQFEVPQANDYNQESDDHLGDFLLPDTSQVDDDDNRASSDHPEDSLQPDVPRANGYSQESDDLIEL